MLIGNNMITPEKYCGKYNQIGSFSAVQPFQWANTYSSSALTLFDPNRKEPQLILLATPVLNRLFRGKMSAGKKVCCGTQFIVFSIKRTSLHVNMLHCGKYISYIIQLDCIVGSWPLIAPQTSHTVKLPILFYVTCEISLMYLQSKRSYIHMHC